MIEAVLIRFFVGRLSLVAISYAGAIVHTAVQIAVASAVVNVSLIAYFPIAGAVAGVCGAAVGAGYRNRGKSVPRKIHHKGRESVNGYETVQNSTTTEEIKRSRFITEVRRVKGEEELVRGTRRDPQKVFGRDPRVLCGGIRQIRTCGAVSDDGEPSELPVSRYSKR